MPVFVAVRCEEQAEFWQSDDKVGEESECTALDPLSAEAEHVSLGVEGLYDSASELSNHSSGAKVRIDLSVVCNMVSRAA